MNPDHPYTDAGTQPSSRNIARGFALLALMAIVTRAASAQDAGADSLAVRLQRAEAAIVALQVQVAEQEQRTVRSASGMTVELTGRVAVNAFANTRRVNNVDNPQFVQPDPAPGTPVRGAGMSIRQTRVGLALGGATALGGTFTGDLDVDFYGGQQPSGGGRTFPLIRLRTARAFVRWSRADLMIGQESPLVSGVNPVTPAAIGSPGFAGAGNLWLWLPQVRAGLHSNGAVRWAFEGAVLAPTSGDPAAPFDTDNDMAERSQRPYLQARASARWGDGDHVKELGCGYHVGWLVPAMERIRSDAIACDAVLPVTESVELRGEFFSGQALRGLGGGGVGQNVVLATNAPLETSGGWVQLNLRPFHALMMGVGCGTDVPGRGAARTRNDACAVYSIVRPVGPLFFGGELRRLRTGYPGVRYTSDHVTLTAGFEL